MPHNNSPSSSLSPSSSPASPPSQSSPPHHDSPTFRSEISDHFGILMNHRHSNKFRWPTHQSLWVSRWSSVLKLAYLVWFFVQIAAFSVSDQSRNSTNNITNQLILTTYTHLPFATQGLLGIAVLSVLHFSSREQSRAARFLAFIITHFCTLVWFIHIDKYIAIMNPSNPLCDGASNNYFCQISKASTILSIIMEGSTFFLALYSLLDYIVPMWRSSSFLSFVFSEERIPFEDLIHIEAEAHGDNREITAQINNKNDNNWWLTNLSLSGYAISMFSFIYISTYSNIYDIVFYSSIRSISLVYGFALSLAAYTVYRRNRYLHSASSLMSLATATMIWSFFIYDGRRPLQLVSPTPSSPASSFFDYPTDIGAQTGLSIGLGLIMCSETLRFFVQLGRAMTFVAVDPTLFLRAQVASALNNADKHTILSDKHSATSPLSTRPLLGGNSPIFTFLLVIMSLLEVTWFLVQLYLESEVGVFNPVITNYGTFFLTKTVILTSFLFIFQILLFVAIFGTLLYAEKHRTFSSYTASIRVNVVCFASWWLIAFPYAYSLIYRSGTLSNEVCNTIPDANNANNANGGLDSSITDQFNYCSGSQGVGVLSCIIMIGYFLVFLYNVGQCASHYFKEQAEKEDNANEANGANVSADLAHQHKHKLCMRGNISLVLINFGLYIWALASIWETVNGVSDSTLIAQMFTNGQIGLYGGGNTFLSWQDTTQLEGSWAIVVILSFLMWTSSQVFLRDSSRENHWMKSLSFAFSVLSFVFIFPIFIISCRFIGLNYVSNNSGQKGQITGFILLFIGTAWNAMIQWGLLQQKEEGVKEDITCGPQYNAMGYNVEELLPRVSEKGKEVDVEMAKMEEHKEKHEREESTSQVEFHY